jgi:hypothetical protein
MVGSGQILRGSALKLLEAREATEVIAVTGVLKGVPRRRGIDSHAADWVQGALTLRTVSLIMVVVLMTVLGHGSGSAVCRTS